MLTVSEKHKQIERDYEDLLIDKEKSDKHTKEEKDSLEHLR